jgi:hypothetical protein
MRVAARPGLSVSELEGRVGVAPVPLRAVGVETSVAQFGAAIGAGVKMSEAKILAAIRT